MEYSGNAYVDIHQKTPNHVIEAGLNENECRIVKRKRFTSNVYCKVCGQEADGIHYGIPSCDPCKCFFNRSITAYKKYICRNDRYCLERYGQKSCRFCRLKACIRAGMSCKARKIDKNFISTDDRFINDNGKTSSDLFFLTSKPDAEQTDYFKRMSFNCQLESMKIINILPKTIHLEKYLNTRKESELILLTLLKDKCFQMYNRYIKIDQSMIDYAKKESLNPFKSDRLPGWDATDEFVRKIFIESILRFSDLFERYASELPGFNQLLKNDLKTVTRERRNLVYGMRQNDIFIDNEFYFIESGVQMSRSRMNSSWSTKQIDMICQFHNDFKQIKFTTSEISLLIPVLLTAPQSGKISNQKYLDYINRQYNHAFFYELHINKRTDKSIDEIIKFIDSLEKMNNQLK